MHIIQKVERSTYHQTGPRFAAVVVSGRSAVSLVVDPKGPGFDTTVGFEVLEKFRAGWKRDGIDQRQRETQASKLFYEH
jgi:hypothetical protein